MEQNGQELYETKVYQIGATTLDNLVNEMAGDDMRLIDADELCEGRVDNDPVVIAAKCAPTIDPESLLPRGHWKTRGRAIVCSICAEPYFCQDYEKPKYKYCPNCGAKMRED